MKKIIKLIKKIIAFTNGKKSYVVVILAAVGVVLQASGTEIPSVVWQLLGLAGLGAVRSAVKKLEPYFDSYPEEDLLDEPPLVDEPAVAEATPETAVPEGGADVPPIPPPAE